MDLNGDNEKANVETIFWSAMDMLSDDDKKLPQVSHMLPLLKRGIGVHHSGLLPILKEVIEILFQEGLHKCLFATETFSIGLNMPAKTVVFTNVRKFDDDKFRWLSSGEYIQMSGRAGHRGIDKRGICILMVDEKLEPSTAKMMLKGSADCLNSAFHLSYNMLLNQLRSEDSNPENLLRNSFYQFEADRAIPSLEKQAKDLEKERDSIIIEEEDSVKNYYNLLQQYKSLKQELRDFVFSPKYCLPFLKPGRLVTIQCAKSDENSSFSFDDPVIWGVILNFQRVKTVSEDDASRKPKDANYTVDLLTRCGVSTSEVAKKTIKIIPLKEPGEPAVVSISISQVEIDVDSFVGSFQPDIMEAVYAWAEGSKFYEIMSATPVFEGSLIRAIRRLEEVLQQLIQAAKSVGETELESKFEEAVSKIKRDIVFAASLYL